jgi:hypothetical protein
MRFLLLALITLFYTTLVSNAQIQLEKRAQSVPKFGSGTKMVRGVNLGGWFVLESW